MLLRLLLVLGVDADGDGTVVEELTLHVCTKLSSADRLAKAGFDLTDELLIKWYGNIVARGADVARTIALGREGVEGELADDEDLALDVEHRTVHDMILVIEDTEAEYLARYPLHILDGICGLKAYQDEESETYF